MPPRLVLLAIATVVLGLFPGPAVASAVATEFAATPAGTTIIEPPGSHYRYQRWVEEARVPTPPGTIAVVEHTDQPGDCDVLSLACTDGHTIWFYAGVADRWSFMHELGHIAALRTGAAPFEDERFADIYASCAFYKIIPRDWYPVSGGDLTGRRLRPWCQGIRALFR
jgi:hypothetical protein